MAVFVIVHGGWGGGWEWTPVARELRQRGHEVYTPTLTGLGERAHLGGTDISLSDHIEDVLAVFTFEELRDAILCGHSSSGMVVTGVADRVSERIQRLIYVDAFVPTDGQSLRDLLPADFAAALLDSAEEGKIPMPADLYPPAGVISTEARTSYIARTRPHPAKTLTEPLTLSGAVSALPRAYVRCTADPEGDLYEPYARRARAEGWPYREIATAHDLQLIDPAGTAAVLHDLATT